MTNVYSDTHSQCDWYNQNSSFLYHCSGVQLAVVAQNVPKHYLYHTPVYSINTDMHIDRNSVCLNLVSTHEVARQDTKYSAHSTSHKMLKR